MQTANKRLINVGVGLVHKVVPGIAILAGFHTDFNYYDEQALPREENFVNSISYWNLYHISGGIIWHKERFDLNLGALYVGGKSSGDRQQINLTDPKDYRLLQGEREFSTVTRTGRFMLVLGFSYKFPRI